MTSKEALKRLKQETAPSTYMADFDKDECIEIIKQDLEILEILRNHLYVASGLVELKITSKEYANIHKVKYHNGIPIVNQDAIDKINKWYYRSKNNDK